MSIRSLPKRRGALIVRDRVSLAFFLPAFYRDKIRSVPGVTSVVPLTWFGGRYIDDRPEHFFAQMGTDPEEYLKGRVRQDCSAGSGEGLAAGSRWSAGGRHAGEEIRLEDRRSDYFAGQYFPGEP